MVQVPRKTKVKAIKWTGDNTAKVFEYLVNTSTTTHVEMKVLWTTTSIKKQSLDVINPFQDPAHVEIGDWVGFNLDAYKFECFKDEENKKNE